MNSRSVILDLLGGSIRKINSVGFTPPAIRARVTMMKMMMALDKALSSLTT